jgi:Prokaryotic homologs of the JAB domain
MFRKIKARRWWDRFYATADRKTRRKVLVKARRLQKKKHWIWRGVDIEAGGLLLGSLMVRHKRTKIDKDDLTVVNLRNGTSREYWKRIRAFYHKRLTEYTEKSKRFFRVRDKIKEETTEVKSIGLKLQMVLEYRLPGRVYTVVKLGLWHWKDLRAGKTILGSWHSHPTGPHEPSKADEELALKHKEKLGLDVYYLGIEQCGVMKFWKY